MAPEEAMNSCGFESISTARSSVQKYLTASQFPHTIQWDFHNAHPDWIKRADFIYSNPFDHSYDPEACINTWVNCFRPGGLCVLELSDYHGAEKVSMTDLFGADIEVMPYLLTLWAKERFFVRAHR